MTRGGGGLATAGDMASLASKEPSGDPVGRGLRQPGKIGKTSLGETETNSGWEGVSEDILEAAVDSIWTHYTKRILGIRATTLSLHSVILFLTDSWSALGGISHTLFYFALNYLLGRFLTQMFGKAQSLAPCSFFCAWSTDLIKQD